MPEKRICPSCGTDYTGCKVLFCDRCGAQLPLPSRLEELCKIDDHSQKMKSCTEIGHSVGMAAGLWYCPQCGKRLVS